MTHSEARLLIGADPHAAPPPELAEHLGSCAECAQFQREMRELEGDLRRVLELPPAGGSPATVTAGAAPQAAPIPITNARSARRRQLRTMRSGWALAASVAITFTIAIWALRPNDTLAHDVVMHVGHEPASWASTQPVPSAEVNKIMSKAGVALDMSSDKVVYARTCPVRGHEVPHLVVKTAQGPMTVIVLPDVMVKKRSSFHESGMTGVIVPAPRGSLAILAQGDENIDAVAEQVRRSVRWLP